MFSGLLEKISKTYLLYIFEICIAIYVTTIIID